LSGALIALAASAGWSQTSQSIVSALRAQRYAQALELADQALKSAPADAQILTLKGMALKGLSRDDPALAAFRQALRISPDYLAALEGAVEIEYTAGRLEAIPLLDRLLKLRPDEPTAHAMRAVMAWKQKDCATAVAHFERSSSVLGSQPDALREYGICLVRLERFEPAASVFAQLVATQPSDRPARYSLASAHIMAERFQNALDSLKPLLAAAGPDPEALAIASAAHEALGDTPTAVAMLRQAIVLSPRKIRYYVEFADLSFAHKSYDAGIQIVTAGLQLSPDSSQLHLARGILYVQNGQAEQADADFAAAERLDPRQPGTADARVLEYLQQNQFDSAVQLVRTQIRARPDDAFLYYLLAEVLNWQGPTPGSPEFQQAMDAAAKAVQLQPSLALARNLLSRLYLDAGRVEAAIQECRAVLRADPNNAVALYRLMRALKASSDPEDAKQIPEVVRKFNEARALAGKKEAQDSRYRLVEDSAAIGK
jgi:tetratricopeptide (TPR) repeat protein